MRNYLLSIIFIITGTWLKAEEGQKLVLKSFNFKLYYTHGGEKLAEQLLNQAESNLETMENFLGTRLVEQIDIFLSEQRVEENKIITQRNGNIVLNNSSIYLFYKGNTPSLFIQLREQLAEILINNMLYGNTIKERLKNNREINVPDWYVTGLAKYVAGGKEPNTGWMADYYEGKLKLNLNLTEKSELGEFGHAVFSHIYDSFGINKLRQLLFYTKLSGKTEYAFEYVLNKSLNWVLFDWYKIERTKYLKNNMTRLPNDPESIPERFQTADIIDIKFDKTDPQLHLLIKTVDGAELWNYSMETRKMARVFRYHTASKNNVYAFIKKDRQFLLSVSNGFSTQIFLIENHRVKRTLKMDFSYIYLMKEFDKEGLVVLAQKNFKTDIYKIDPDNRNEMVNLTNTAMEETDFIYDKQGELYVVVFSDSKYSLLNFKTKKTIYTSADPMAKLNIYKSNYLSFIQMNNALNYGMIVNLEDTGESFQVTNYNRSIFYYDYNPKSQKVMEGLMYGKKNYLVVSDASVEKANLTTTDALIPSPGNTNVIPDTFITSNFGYKFITGFEFRKSKVITPGKDIKPEMKSNIKIRSFPAPLNEFKPDFIKLGYSNTTFNSPLFASFYPIRQGLYNGSNVIVGCGISDLNKKYFIQGNIRQPLTGKGTDLDFSLKTIRRNSLYGIQLFNSVYQRELYNQLNRYIIREIRFLTKVKWRSRIMLTLQTGYRYDASFPLSESIENLKTDILKLRQAFLESNADINLLNRSRLNYGQKITTSLSMNLYKPLGSNGIISNVFFKLKHEQLFYRLFRLSTQLSLQSSVGKQKTVWLMGGVSNWLRPIYANAPVYYPQNIVMYSSMTDFAGLPYNYRSGSSAGVVKLKLDFPINPLLSQQNFNQNIFKFLTIRALGNLGTVWYGNNPFSINNPENEEIIETGTMTITNYVAKNPLIWSWGFGANSVLFGYELGIDYALGYNERGLIGKFSYLTIGREF